jgi:hypothetical protein
MRRRVAEKCPTRQNPQEENFTPLKTTKSYVYFYNANSPLTFVIFFYFSNIESKPFSAGYIQIYVIGIDPLETFLDVLIRVAEQSYAFKT